MKKGLHLREKLLKKGGFSFMAYLLATTTAFFIVIAIAIGFLVSGRYSRTMLNRQLDSAQTSMYVSANQVGQILTSARLAATVMRSDTRIDDYLYGAFSSESELVYARRLAMNRMMAEVNANPVIQGLFFMKSDGTLCGYSAKGVLLPGDEQHPLAADETIVRDSAFQGVSWLAPYQLSDLKQTGSAPVNMDNVLVLGAIKEHYRLSYEEDVHALVTLVAVDNAQLRACFDYLCDSDTRLYLANEDGKCIYALGDEWSQSTVDCWESVDAAAESGCVQRTGPEKALEYVVYQRVPGTGWYLIKATSARLFQRDLRALQMNVLWIAAALLAVATEVYALWSRRSAASLDTLSRAMEQMQQGDLSLRIEKPMDIREYEAIRRQFNRMADSIEQLVEETRQMERERVTLEARALQTQLSPHMIFNSISAIRWMATVLGVEQISEMLGALATLLQPVFREWRLSWTLREELAHLENYMVLLKLRYSDAISTEIDIPEALMDYTIPCFVLQPVLENCFEHNAGGSEGLCVRIGARLDGDWHLAIVVSDNGGGREPEALERLRESLARPDEPDAPRRGIGLRNVHRKLQLLCGQNSGLQIDSLPGLGTTVALYARVNVRLRLHEPIDIMALS